MKKLLVLFLVLTLVGCGANDSTSDEDVTKIGVLQLMDHEALNNAYDGFIAALNDNGYVEGENLEIEFQNPNNDKSSLPTMAQQLVSSSPDLILAIGTGSAQALQQETSEIPILGTAITDYVEVGLVASNDEPGANISGSSDYCDMDVQMDLVETLVPDVKRVGLLYTSSEQNSIVQAEQMKAECERRGWEVVEKTISDLTMVNDAMTAFIGDIDALYIPTDNPLASSMASVETIASENKIPTIVGCDTMVEDGGLASIGVNYYDLGYQTGLNTIKVIEGEVNISELPIYFMTSETATIYYNSLIAERMGYELPAEILENGIDMAQ